MKPLEPHPQSLGCHDSKIVRPLGYVGLESKCEACVAAPVRCLRHVHDATKKRLAKISQVTAYIIQQMSRALY